MGRNRDKAPVQIQLDPGMKQLLQDIARREGRSMAKQAEYVLTQAIHEYMQNRAKEEEDLPEANSVGF